MDPESAANEITDAIAQIEMHRQESAKQVGLAAACSEALRRLHEILGGEQDAQQRHGPGTRHAANIRALTAAIEKAKALAGPGNQGAGRGQAPAQGQKTISPAASHRPPRNRGRRTMGRHGNR